MKSLCVIPSRYASTRLPGKPLVDLDGESLIQRVYHRVEDTGLMDKIVVATDDNRIFKHCSEFNIPVQMTSSDHPSGTDRVAEVSRLFPEYDIVLNVQGDEPLIEGELLENMIMLLLSKQEGIVTGVAPITHRIDDPNVVKVVMDCNARALYFSRSPIPFQRGNDAKSKYYRHIGTYGFWRSTLEDVVKFNPSMLEQSESLEQLRWLENGKQIHCIVGPWKGIGVDTPEDVKRMINLLSGLEDQLI